MCGTEFIVSDSHMNFYKTISPKLGDNIYLIPPPKLCPRCREQRRLSYRNDRKLYRRLSSLSGESIISFYHPSSPWQVYSHDEWWSDRWDATRYGRDFDFNRGFFEQFYDLQSSVPRPPLINNKAENSPYCNFADANRNCYLLTCSNRNEDSYYGYFVLDSKDSVDCTYCMFSELLYECVDCDHCYNLSYSQQCVNCTESSYLWNCRGASNSLFCSNLKDKEQYHILNRPASKSEYQKVLSLIKSDTEYRSRFIEQWEQMKLKYPVKALNLISCENVIGNDIFNSKNIEEGFTIWESQDCAFVQDGLTSANCMDICFFEKSQWCYESMSLIGYSYRFTNFCRDSSNLWYCDNCHGSKNLFGCIGIRNKEYCILNKQYSREDYEETMAKIIKHMDARGEWGEYFPTAFSLFGYNETLAQDFFPLSKEQAIALNFPWRD